MRGQGTRAFAREHAERMKAVERHVGEGVGAARNHRVGEPRLKKTAALMMARAELVQAVAIV